MELTELVIAEADGRAVAQTAECELDMAYGVEENDFSLTLPSDLAPPCGGMIYIDGTEWVGWVDEVTTDTSTRCSTCKGRTAHGVLAAKRVVPDAGEPHVSISGDVGSAMRSLLSRVGLLGSFEVSSDVPHGEVSFRFERFCDAWSGLRSMLRSCSMRPTITCADGRIVVGAELVSVAAGAADSDLVGLEITRVSRCVNHLVCGGAGELENRVVVHYYADADGTVSETQSLFGVDEVAAFYDFSGADEQKLREDGRAKLEELQTRGSVKLTVPEDLDAGLGDVLVGRDNVLGVEVRAEVVKKVLRLSSGVMSVEVDVGQAASSASTISGSGESQLGGVGYVAGEGISIAGGTISADVTQAELDAVSAAAGDARKLASDAQATAGAAIDALGGKADKGHTHPYLPTTGGKVTGSVSLDNGSDAANLSLIRKADAGTVRATLAVNPDATTVLLAKNETSGAYINALKLKADRTELDKPLTIASGGTGAKTAAGALAAIGAAAKEHGHTWGEVDGKPTSYPPSHHVHRYAGAAEAGGAADSALKLATARAIKITGAVSGSAVFDGSRDVEISVEGNQALAGFLSAHPVGFFVECRAGCDPNEVGGVWEQAPSVGPCVWLRTG